MLQILEGVVWDCTFRLVKEICIERYMDKVPDELSFELLFMPDNKAIIRKDNISNESNETYNCRYYTANNYVFIIGSDLDNRVQERWILEVQGDNLVGETSHRDFTTNSFVVGQLLLKPKRLLSDE